MDTFNDSEPGQVLGLGAESNKTHPRYDSCPYEALKSNRDVGSEVASKYMGKSVEPYNQQRSAKTVNYSSDDDSDIESSSMSLVALAAKHKSNLQKFSDVRMESVSVPELDLPSVLLKQKIDSSDSSIVIIHKDHLFSDQYSIDEPFEFNDKSLNKSKHLRLEEKTSEVVDKFVAASFSDDSDSDEPMCLQSLALIHAKSVNHGSSESMDNVQSLKPHIKELQNIASYHRHHTKSESDRYSSSAVHLSDNLLKKSLENSVSTSLRSLRGGGHQEMGLQFSPGGSIPGSFKSLTASNSLNSSLASVTAEAGSKWQGSYNDVCCVNSDSDVIFDSNSLDNPFGKRQELVNFQVFPSVSNKKSSEHIPSDKVDGGINLSCALKKSSRERTSESLLSESSSENKDAEDEEIVTLLDSLLVDETVAEDNIKKDVFLSSEMDTSCKLDISNVLKVKVELRTRKCSSFGKVICRQWRLLRTPYIRKDKLRTRVIPFDFIEPSPDDAIANAFKRRL